jgi:hypothetical protein
MTALGDALCIESIHPEGDVMPENPKHETEQPDVTQLWREWLTQSERQFNAFFNEMMKTESFGRAAGSYVEAFAAFQRLTQDAMERYLAFMNLPSKTDVTGLGDTLRSIEDRLAHIEETLQIAADAVEQEYRREPYREPARTRTPPGVPQSQTPIPEEMRR